MSDQFGNYELLEKLAVGGMAEIFLARTMHGQGVEKQIVIKRIHPTLSVDRTFVAMFIDEARLGVSMVHSNIVPVFDFGCIDGYYFLAMEYIAGENLSALSARAVIVEERWPFDLALHVIVEVLEGLAYAHEKRDQDGRLLELVHRDVSPSNVLVSFDGQVKLLDFGIARSLAREFETRTGVIKGKPDYMSPEQAGGGEVDHRADIWSCCAILHELLTGQRLKEGRITIEDDATEAVLSKALAVDPEDRYPDARAFQLALADILYDKKLRPNAGDLAKFVKRVTTTSAAGDDWDMQSSGVEDHLANALDNDKLHSGNLRESAGIGTIDQGVGPTLRINPKKNRSGFFALLSIVVAIGIISLFWNLQVERTILPEDPPDSLPNISPRPIPESSRKNSVEPESSSSVVSTPAEVTLKSSRSALDVVTRPPGARLFVDGIERGVSPIILKDVEPGSHRIAIKLAGHQTVEREIVLRAETPTSLDLEMIRQVRRHPPTPAKLSVNTDPWSHVTLDDKQIGTTPIIDLEIRPGEHHLTLNNPMRDLTKKIMFTVKPGQSRRISEILVDE
jgi:eukaryotic-like serine/threonine-protein kinase